MKRGREKQTIMDIIIKTPQMGEILLEEFMKPMGISANKLAQDIYVPVSQIQDILHDRRKITPDMAIRLARYFGVHDCYFLDRQNEIDVKEIKEKKNEEILAIRPHRLATERRKLPIGVQSFEKLREERAVYVDKTKYVYRLVHEVTPFFLSRPRRFGKSLLLSSIRAYWEGKKELFSGLEIERLEADNPDAWKPRPVLYFDFNGMDYSRVGALEEILSNQLTSFEKKYGCENGTGTPEIRFRNLLANIFQKTGQRCVILIDEYDKPLLDLIDEQELQEHNKAVFKGFFSNLKSCDDYIRFVFIMGVTKFHKVSIFSDLNQLNDISLSDDFSGICGITENELVQNFDPEIRVIAENRGIEYEECLDILKRQYDGYHFSADGVGLYNPFSLLKAFYDKRLGSFWFGTGTPAFLVKSLRNHAFEARKLSDKTIYVSESGMSDYTGDTLNLFALLYQTGYLTITDYDHDSREYILAFPNGEVKYGFLEALLPEYVSNCSPGSGVDVFSLRRYLIRGDLENVRDVLTALFASIPYTTNDAPFEHYFQSVIYLVFTLLGQYSLCEMHTFNGRIDCKVETDGFVYLFEFKRDESAEKALQQIEDKSYSLVFAADQRKLYKIGVSFDSEKRILADWKVSE